ncbi:hypothetical protein [Aureispira anguillae]|uniref:Uncharacterized protein n=1 Tax=Aureispira anguillae TaxID=2864201 RepID=A0A915YCF5_9BACT|nr:hypothetical protein [Aureispira anguillae]BDS10520.1 hypothetical protein AsAng_0012280 [Aureispira anguillae]
MKFLFLILFVPLLVTAQVNLSTDLDVKLGSPYKVIDAEEKNYFSLDGNRSIAVKTYKGKVFIQVFDTKTTKELYRNDYNDFPKKIDYFTILKINHKAYYVYSYFDKKSKYSRIAAREIKASNGTLGSSKTLVSTKERFWGLGIHSFGNPIWHKRNTFQIIKSSDESKFLIQYSNFNYKKDIKLAFGFHVFDKNMKKLWYKNKALLPYDSKEVGCLAYTLSNTGKIYSLVRIWKEQRFEICSIDQDYKIKNNKLDFPKNIFPAVAQLKEDKDGNIVCSVLYEKDVTAIFMGKVLVQGILYFKVDKEGNLLAQLDYEYPKDFAAQYTPKEKKEKKKHGIANLKLLEVLSQKDGSTILICEQQEINTKYGPNATTSYDYGNVVLAKFNSDASLSWIKKIPKRQTGGGILSQKSIKYIHTNNYHYVLYVDNPKNLNIKADELPALHKSDKGGFLTLCKIDNATGKYDKHTVLDMQDVDGKVADQFHVTRIYEVDATQQLFMMECYIKGKKDAMVKIKLK